MQTPEPRPSRSIAWIVQGSERGGGQQATINLIKAVKTRGWKTRVLSLSRGQLTEECAAQGLPFECLEMGLPEVLHGGLLARVMSFGRGIRHQQHAAAAVTERLRTDPPDVVHTIWSNLMVTAGIAARNLNAVCIWEMAKLVGGRYPFGLNRRVLQWQAQRYAVTVLANSRYTGVTFGNWPVAPILFYLGADAQRFDPAVVYPVTRADLGIPANATVLGILGRMVPLRGQDHVLRAMLQLIASGQGDPAQPLHLLLVGGPLDTPYVQSLRQLALAAGLADRLHITGQVRDSERYYGCIDVVLSSYLEAESFGLAPVEAMLMDRPVLAHACGGPAETVVDGITGWHIPDATEPAFAAGILRALADRPRWPSMGAAGRTRALSEFTTQRQAHRYLEIVESLLHQTPTK